MPRGGYREGAGRKPGIPNKDNADIRAMIIGALNQVGGAEYLAARAIDTPGSFLTLISKVLPLQVTGEGGGPVFIVTGVLRDEEDGPETDNSPD